MANEETNNKSSTSSDLTNSSFGSKKGFPQYCADNLLNNSHKLINVFDSES